MLARLHRPPATHADAHRIPPMEDPRTRLRFGPYELCTLRRMLWRDGKPCAIGGRAFDLLLLLVQHRHRVVSRNELLEHGWPSLAVEPNNLQVQIWALRKLLGRAMIVTVARRGYQYVGPPVSAPGARPTALAVAGSSAPGEHVLRRTADAHLDRHLCGPAHRIPHPAGGSLPDGETDRRRLRWRGRSAG